MYAALSFICNHNAFFNSYILWTQRSIPVIRFEKEIKIKVQQKIKGNSKEDTILKSAFKFFDSLNSGCVDKPNFCKACEKLGVFIDAKAFLLSDT